MIGVLKKYQITNENGLVEIEELDNGIVIETIIEPSAEYLQSLAEQPNSPPPEPGDNDYLLELDFRISMIELGL